MLSSDRLLKAVIYTLALGSLLGMAAVVCTRPAKAQATVITRSCSLGQGSFGCRTTVIPGGWAKPVIQYAPRPWAGSPEAIAQEGRIAEWEARCVVGFRYDDQGVKYYVYKDKACEHGY